MCITMFANTVGFFALAEIAESITVWDGTDNYTSLDDVLTDLGAADSDGYYHIKTANQLHAVIKYNGGGNSYKLDNDLYLNADYENYISWGTSAPANTWDFTGHSGNVPKYKFYGTIDGCGHTIYGLYSGSGYYAGLIGGLNVFNKTVIKNLNVYYSYIRASKNSGVIVGGNFYESGLSGNVEFSGCSVRNAYVHNVWNNGAGGGLIGLTCMPVSVNNCSVIDVNFTSGANAGDSNGVSSIGSFVGALYSGAVGSITTYNTWQGKCVVIENSYAVNTKITDKAGNETTAYPSGLYQDGTSANWCFSITANNVYTDSTDVSTNYAGTVKLLVSSDGKTAIEPSADNYPIKTIAAADIIGASAKTAMPNLNWYAWNVVENDYPVYKELDIWDGTDNYGAIDTVLADMGYADSEGYYHISTAEQLHAVIRNNGGGYKYKLDNDLYLNADWENYQNWTNTNGPDNVWDFTSSKASPAYAFTGTIDGCGHTIYGLYSKADKAYGGLIGSVAGDTMVKNLNVYNSYVRAANSTGIIIGGNWYANSSRDMKIEIIGCSVRYAVIDNVWNNGAAGGIIGMTCKPTVISNCSVIDVKMTSGANAADANKFGCMGSFVGALNAGLVSDTSVYDITQGSFLRISDSYAVGVVNASNSNAPVYVSGIYMDGSNWGYSITANNIYTDATDVTENTDGSVKLMVSSDGKSALEPFDAGYPIKKVDVSSIIGDGAKLSMPLLNWNAWQVVESDYPIYSDLVIWDGTDNFGSLDELYASMNGSGTESEPYIITNASQLHAAIRLGGGDKYYKLANDLYLNSNWEDYASWSNSNTPDNDWGLNGSGVTFSGTIDGNNKAIYGYFNNGIGKEYVGLIPAVNTASGATQNVTIKNLDMLYCAQGGNNKVGFLIGGTWTAGNGNVVIENSTVKHANIYMIWDSNAIGGMVGMASGKTAVTINHCAVEDIDFNAKGAGTTGFTGYASYGSIVGCTNNNLTDTYDFSSGQASSAKIYNSYAFDCINTKNDKLLYICGIYPAAVSSYCVTAVNVYTDTEEIPTSLDGYCQLLVSEDGITENNTVVVPTVENYAPLFEDGAWYMGKFGDNNPMLKCRTEGYAYLDITGEGIEDKYTATDVVYIRKNLLGVKEYAYICGNVDNDSNNQINIIDLVRIKKILAGK